MKGTNLLPKNSPNFCLSGAFRHGYSMANLGVNLKNFPAPSHDYEH